jgi:hypothetical protein
MRVLVTPAESRLHCLVQVGDGVVVAHQQATPDQRADTTKDDAQLMNDGLGEVVGSVTSSSCAPPARAAPPTVFPALHVPPRRTAQVPSRSLRQKPEQPHFSVRSRGAPSASSGGTDAPRRCTSGQDSVKLVRLSRWDRIQLAEHPRAITSLTAARLVPTGRLARNASRSVWDWSDWPNTEWC